MTKYKPNGSWSLEQRQKFSLSKIGTHNPNHSNEKHSLWKGDNASKSAFHIWIRKNFPPPSNCTNCGKEKDNLDLANITGIYDRDFNNYTYLCRKCHMIYDDQKTKHWVTRKKNVTVKCKV